MKPTEDISTLDDVRQILADLPGPDTAAAKRASIREPRLTKPPGSLGRLEELSAWLCAWQGRHPPRIERPAARVFAGSHGVVARGVSAYPAEVTAQMVANFRAGGAAINQLCRVFDIQLEVHALDLDRPTRDFTAAPAMSETECVEAFVCGMGTASADQDLLCLGEMGIGNTTAAAAVCHGLYGGGAADWTGPGTGVAGDTLAHKAVVVAEAVDLHAGTADDPLDLLRRLGGREMAAIAGAVVGARLNRVPVLLDGYVCTAAAAPLEAFLAGALDHCQVAHVSAEPGHRRLVNRLAKPPLFDLNMRLGEASGAALAVAVVKAAAACHAGMATFDEAGVSNRGKN
jgi:nicotinate-nucleotide--dimethylbenzimidazole phosphoribosyltransferase